ncbi:Holliday junction resolvase RuvX [Candidatus Parcubacteria bacterium]|nr:Holliday junction resolvase RuvX [Candidatus Parcubacteria bacterium]
MNKKRVKYIGIDWGEKRLGLALGDNEAKLATPFKVVSSINEIEQAIKEENVDIVVVGKPVKMSGNEKLSDEFIKFVNALKSKFKIPIELIDERLSSKAADALSGNKKTKAPRDAVAAMLILQSYLDKT